ncbi:MAG: dihydrodipicolinate synthase family protein, partial [Chloroflexota bacterium]|nr:dihydrodipicolinate synthase family protein [Chloroflexota bacterium]
YNKPPQEGLFQHFKAIAGATKLPCIVYNVPSRTSLNMTAETTVRLSNSVENIVGVKEASSNMDQIAQIIGESRKGFLVWSGNDSETFIIMAMGGYGIISVASHVVGKQIKNMMELLLAGKIKESAAENIRLMPIFKGLFVVTNPIPVKYCTNKVLRVGAPRLPLVPPDEKTAAFLDGLMKKYTIDLPAPVAR